MAKRTRKRSRLRDEYTQLSIEVQGYEAESDISLNWNLRGPIFGMRDDDLAHWFITTLEIRGTCVYPANRAGELYTLRVHGAEPHPGTFSTTLRDYLARDKQWQPLYRMRRGEREPIFDPPKGVTVLMKQWGKRSWDVPLDVQPHLASDMLRLLTSGRRLYLSIYERKIERVRWAQHVTLQTRDPAEE